jgi:probable phosphoglycerate mutase
MAAMQIELPLKALTIFNEIDYGPDENQPEAQVLARIGKAALEAWEARAVVPDGWHVDPAVIIKNWQAFADQLSREYADKTILVVTSNGIARFAPYLTGDFAAFSAQHAIKIATGACALFEKNPAAPVWDCLAWNVKPGALMAR